MLINPNAALSSSRVTSSSLALLIIFLFNVENKAANKAAVNPANTPAHWLRFDMTHHQHHPGYHKEAEEDLHPLHFPPENQWFKKCGKKRCRGHADQRDTGVGPFDCSIKGYPMDGYDDPDACILPRSCGQAASEVCPIRA
jgi:hypothetical protein